MYNHIASHPHSRRLPWSALWERKKEKEEEEEEREGGGKRRNGGVGKEEEKKEGEGGGGEEKREGEERERKGKLQQNLRLLVHTYTVLINGSCVKACGVMAVSLLLSIFL